MLTPMLKDFHLIHRRKPHTFSANPQALVWETCLRSIAFTSSPEAVSLEESDELYVQQHAYRFLLEIICGLHSPIVGETEVFGQFKIFAKEWQAREPYRATLIQRLFTEAKEIRSRHLCGLGTQSYGGWIKRQLHAREVHILGAGQLAQEIVPYISKAVDSVTVHARNKTKVSIQNVGVASLNEKGFTGGALIIAAPISAEMVHQWLGSKEPLEVFDLRAESASDPLRLPSTRALHDVFAEIEQTKARLLPIIEQVKCEIEARSERLAAQSIVRPQGWDDICA